MQSAHQVLQNISAIADKETNPTFSMRINALDKEGVSLAPSIVINPGVIISYGLNGQNIRYTLTKGEAGNNSEYVDYIETEGFIGLQVVGMFQGNGKLDTVGFGTNASDLSTNTLRATIRKNAFKLITGATAGKVTSNGVAYYEGNTKLTSIPAGANTIVVKNGNLTIAGNLDRNGQGLGIIVVNEAGVTSGGNIYITPGVTSLSAMMYADKSLMSVNANGGLYGVDSATRTQDLNQQLILKGTLFTQNTIGGAILGEGKYVLPGGAATTDFNQAMTYDLNYIRRGTNGCDKNGNGKCSDSGEYASPFVIIYNGANATNPPPGFDSIAD